MKTNGPPSGITPEIWGVYQLLLALIGQARRDAQRGDMSAIAFLDLIAPSWRKEARRNVGK